MDAAIYQYQARATGGAADTALKGAKMNAYHNGTWESSYMNSEWANDPSAPFNCEDEVPAGAKFRHLVKLEYVADDEYETLDGRSLCQKGDTYVAYKYEYAKSENGAILLAWMEDVDEDAPEWVCEGCYDDEQVRMNAEVVEIDYDDWEY